MIIDTERLFENAAIGLCIFNYCEKYPYIKFTTWNKSMQKITGFTLQEMNNHGLYCFNSEMNEKINLEKIFSENSELEYEITKKDGTKSIVSINNSIVNEDMETHIISIVRDITKDKAVENRLKEIEKRYNTIMELSQDAVIIHDNGKYLNSNKNALKLFEVENPEDFVGQPVINFVDEQHHELVKERIKKALKAEGTVPIVEEKLITTRGRRLDAEVAATYIPYNGKKCNFIFVRDITKRKQIENALKESEAMLRHIMENSLDMISICDMNCKFKYVTPSHKTILGYTSKELLGQYALDYIHPEEADNIRAIIEEMKHTRKEKLVECRYKCKNGSFKHVEICCKVICNEGEEEVIFSSRDITERVKAEKALKENENKYRYLIDSMPYGIFIMSNAEIIYANKEGLKNLGLDSSTELNNKCFTDFIMPNKFNETDYKKMVEIIKTNDFMPLSEEKFIRTSDNRVFHMETIIMKFPFDDLDDAILVVTRDISDRKKAEVLENELSRAEEYEKLRTEFFANISHELRTPVNVILSTLQLMGSMSIDMKKHKRYEAVMKQNCYRLIRLINNLIDVTKIDAGYFELNLSNNNIVNVVEEITLSVAEYIENKGISLLFDTETEEKIIACDPDKVERIILNLLSNALKFTEPGGSIFINIYDNGETIEIVVKDTGAGIPKEKQELIFERFIQLDKSLTRNSEGSGIGLSLVKALVEMHKGNIKVESELGQGSTFIIQLPVSTVEQTNMLLNSQTYKIQGNIEKINIEFSDIYF